MTNFSIRNGEAQIADKSSTAGQSSAASDAVRRETRRMRLAFAILVALLSLVATSCAAPGGGSGNQEQATNPEDPPKFEPNSTMAEIQKRGKLIVGVRPDANPFSYQDPNTGSWAGFDIEIAKGIAKNIFGEKIEGKVEFIALDALDREGALDRRRVDIAMGRYAISIARKRFVDFAGPYYLARQEIVVQEDSDIDGIAQLNNRKVCTVIGSTNMEALKATLPLADLSMQTRDLRVCNAALAVGSVQAIAGDRLDMNAAITAGGSDFKKLEEPYATEPYGIGVRKNTVDLRQFINDLLEEKISTQWNELYTQTTKDSQTSQPPVDRY